MANHAINQSAPARGAVLTKAAMRAGARFGLSGKLLSDVLGLSETQVSRMRNGEADLSENTRPLNSRRC